MSSSTTHEHTTKVTCDSYYVAAFLQYLGYRCIGCESPDRKPTAFTFLMESQAAFDELLLLWNSPDGQALSSGRHYALALKEIDALQREARRNEFRVWDSPEYLAGR